MPQHTAIVVGAGWAGLACAFELSKAGYHVTLIEAAPQSGGRARTVNYPDILLDNGQHICVGAYHTLRAIIQELGLDERQLFKILPLNYITYGSQTVHLKLPPLPAPYHLISGLLLAQMPWREKLQILKFCYRLRQTNFTLSKDCSVLDMLKNYHQSEFSIKHLWGPLAIGAMTTPITRGSAQIFLRVLQRVFVNKCADSNWYFPAVDLSSLLPSHLEQQLLKAGGQIIYNQPIKKLLLTNDGAMCTEVASNKQSWQADHIILATPAWQTLPLLQTHASLRTSATALASFTYEAITTVYLIFSSAVRLPYPMLGLINDTEFNGIGQWVLDRSFAGQPNILSAVISGTDNIDIADKPMLFKRVLQTIQQRFPWLPDPIQHKIICDKRAAFSCDVAMQGLRPQPSTAVKNLWLTGDYLQTWLPATLEGALISGKATAGKILDIPPRSNQNC